MKCPQGYEGCDCQKFAKVPPPKWEVAEGSDDGTTLYVASSTAPPVRLVIRQGRIELDRLTPLAYPPKERPCR